MNLFDSLNRIALARAFKPDAEANLRYVMRWYSKTFATPLHVVIEEIPVEDIWLAFFEERYAGMTRNELLEYVELALETPEERAARELAEENEEASERAFAEMSAKAAKTPIPIPVNVSPADLLTQVPSLPETTLPAVMEPLQEGIEMTFVDASPEELDKLLDGGMANQTK